jgi:cobalt-precorrin-5B (C1)-methyltransferase
MKKLRSGYTTGACSAAAAKAAALMLLTGEKQENVEIPFPDDSRVNFRIVESKEYKNKKHGAFAAVIKDAGDDPDVTNGARIEAHVCFGLQKSSTNEPLLIFGGKGVGTVTKRGLAIPVGEPAINPVPRKMIRAAVSEAILTSGNNQIFSLEITVSIPDGEALAEKTLNHRLGIIGGLSVLGTTGIVRPVSADAWTATIATSMDVAKEAGINEIILSTGRTSEKAVQEFLKLPEEAQVMMGDYLHFSLVEACNHKFSKIHLSAMWAKVMKCAMHIPQTHVRNGALEIPSALNFLKTLGCDEKLLDHLKGSNTAREIYGRLVDNGQECFIAKVCEAAREYAQKVSGLDVTVYLIDTNKQIVLQTQEVL